MENNTMTTTFNDTYEIRSVIGRGGMSTVYLAEHKRLHTRWAVKQVRKEQGTKFDFLAESNILKKLQHIQKLGFLFRHQRGVQQVILLPHGKGHLGKSLKITSGI